MYLFITLLGPGAVRAAGIQIIATKRQSRGTAAGQRSLGTFLQTLDELCYN